MHDNMFLRQFKKNYNDFPVQIDNFNLEKNHSRQVLQNCFASLAVNYINVN